MNDQTKNDVAVLNKADLLDADLDKVSGGFWVRERWAQIQDDRVPGGQRKDPSLKYETK